MILWGSPISRNPIAGPEIAGNFYGKPSPIEACHIFFFLWYTRHVDGKTHGFLLGFPLQTNPIHRHL
jgi:hypothetical protein